MTRGKKREGGEVRKKKQTYSSKGDNTRTLMVDEGSFHKKVNIAGLQEIGLRHRRSRGGGQSTVQREDLKGVFLIQRGKPPSHRNMPSFVRKLHRNRHRGGRGNVNTTGRRGRGASTLGRKGVKELKKGELLPVSATNTAAR